MRKGVEIACAKRAVRSSEKWWGNILHYYYPKFIPLLYYPQNNNNICFYICAFKNLNAVTIYIFNYLQDGSNIFEVKYLK